MRRWKNWIKWNNHFFSFVFSTILIKYLYYNYLMEYLPKNKTDDLLIRDYYPDIPPETLGLMVGILNRAQQDLQSIDLRLYSDAKQWIDKSEKQDYFLSFESICRCLELDPEKARERIYRVATENKEWKKLRKEWKELLNE